MDEFKDLPPLSPEHLAELVSASPDDDDPFTRHWFTGKYVDQGLEATYQIFHLRLWAPRARLLFGTMAILLFVTSHNSNRNEVVASSNQASMPIDAPSGSHSLTHTHAALSEPMDPILYSCIPVRCSSR
jgi:hypothetical protein